MYDVCAGLKLNSLDMKAGVRFAGSDVVNTYVCIMVSIDTAVELGGLPGRVRWLRKR